MAYPDIDRIALSALLIGLILLFASCFIYFDPQTYKGKDDD